MNIEGEFDEDLVAAVARGDRSAFETLYGRFERRVLGYIRLFAADWTTAEEVLIDTMTAVWFGARDFRAGSRASTWILGIARHKALDAARRRKARRRVERGLEEGEDHVDPHGAPADAVDAHQRVVKTREALSRLSVNHREALRLAFLEELPYDEIADLLDVPINTVKTRVFHAKRQLRKAMDGHRLELRA